MTSGGQSTFNILIVAQSGRLTYEAVLFAASLRHSDPGFTGRLFVAEPQPGPLWGRKNPRISDPAARDCLLSLGAEILPVDSRVFGAAYPPATRAEAMLELPEGEPFVAFDTDTLITGPLSSVGFDFTRPSASMRREGTWPQPELYGPGQAEIWGSLYEKFGLDMAPTLDPAWPDDHWEHFLYFNAGWTFYRCPRTFGRAWLDTMAAIDTDPPPELVCQPLRPWLDQIALPLVIHQLGGGRPGPELAGLDDGSISCHWRVMPLAYARESDHVIDTLEAVSAPHRIKKVLKAYEPFLRMIYQSRGHKARALFDRARLPGREHPIRQRLREHNLWMR